MAGYPGANQYKQTSIMTATPGQILIMLYEGCIKNVKKAIDAIDKKDLAAKGQYILKAHDIINELINSLNFEVGGDVPRELERLYNFMVQQLVQANVGNKKEPLQNVQKLLEDLLGAWKVAVVQAQKEQAQKKEQTKGA